MNFKYVCNRVLKNKLFSAHFRISSLEKPKVKESLREYNTVVMIIYSEKLSSILRKCTLKYQCLITYL